MWYFGDKLNLTRKSNNLLFTTCLQARLTLLDLPFIALYLPLLYTNDPSEPSESSSAPKNSRAWRRPVRFRGRCFLIVPELGAEWPGTTLWCLICEQHTQSSNSKSTFALPCSGAGRDASERQRVKITAKEES